MTTKPEIADKIADLLKECRDVDGMKETGHMLALAFLSTLYIPEALTPEIRQDLELVTAKWAKRSRAMIEAHDVEIERDWDRQTDWPEELGGGL
jgi:hypothetical protein